MKDFRKEFPVANTYTYLNTASCGLLSEQLVAWRHQHDLRLLEGGSLFRDQHKEHIKQIRRQLAGFFSTPEQTVALVPNFSFGMNAIFGGLARKTKVLLLKGDYPSINWPAESHDFELCFADLEGNLEQNVEQAVLEYRPDVFAFSMVQYISGIMIDEDFLKRLKAYNPGLLLISDGTQFLGTTAFDFSESPIDVMGASAYKWLLAGYGNGLFMIKPDAQHRITPRTIGFNSADAAFGMKDEISFVGRLEPGHQDTLNYGSLGESVAFLERTGMNRIERYLKELSDKAIIEFANSGLLDQAIVERKQHSTIFNIKGDSTLFEKLKKHDIVCSRRGKGIRVSFHYYNNEDDLGKLMDVIRS